jgi:hypothetical protein
MMEQDREPAATTVGGVMSRKRVTLATIPTYINFVVNSTDFNLRVNGTLDPTGVVGIGQIKRVRDLWIPRWRPGVIEKVRGLHLEPTDDWDTIQSMVQNAVTFGVYVEDAGDRRLNLYLQRVGWVEEMLRGPGAIATKINHIKAVLLERSKGAIPRSWRDVQATHPHFWKVVDTQPDLTLEYCKLI